MGPVSGQAITLANSIIGVGILAMPFCFKQCGIVLSILLLIVSGLMSRLACHFLLKSAIKSRRRNFEVLAFHVFGNAGKFIVEIGTIGFLMGTCIAYFVVVGDLGPQIIAKMFNINHSDGLRTLVMVVVSVICVLPLGLLKNVDSLSNVCAVTIGFYFCLVLKVIAEATNQIFSKDWVLNVEYWQPDGVLRCLPIFSMSLFCQTQIFEIYDTLPDASLKKMNHVTKNAVSICSAVYVLVGLFGYIGFCNQTISGNILTNFSHTTMSDIMKLGFVMSLAFSFPLIIFPCRASLYSLLYKKGQVAPHDILSNMIPDIRFKCITVSIIVVTLIVSLMVPNIEVVLGFIGSTIGVMICVMFPATCFICLTIKNTNERMLAQLVLCFGIVIMVLGTYANLQAAEIDAIYVKSNEKINLPLIKHNDYMEHNILPPVKETMNDNTKINNAKEEEKRVVDDKKTESRIEPPNPVKPINTYPIDKIDKPAEIGGNINTVKLDNINVDNKKDANEGAGDREAQIDNVLNNLIDDKNTVKELKDNNLQKNTLKDEKLLEEMKKIELMHTIKRHEEEQRQMMKEQKEILKEMKKTKLELEEDNLLKKVEGISHTSAESKKIAMENIQKLAKIAIESLGGKLDIREKSTEAIIKLTNIPKSIKETIDNEIPKIDVQDKNVIDKTQSHKEAVEITTKPHVYEPESYKLGENMQDNKQEKKADVIDNAIRPPIPVEFSKTHKHITSQGKIADAKISTEKPKTVKENAAKIDNEEYVGGKRDILQITDNKTILQVKTSENLNTTTPFQFEKTL